MKGSEVQMPNRQKVIDAIYNCITDPKCRDCPWEDCERFDCKRVNTPMTLLQDALKLLEEDVPPISLKGYALTHDEVMHMAKEAEDELSETRKELGYTE